MKEKHATQAQISKQAIMPLEKKRGLEIWKIGLQYCTNKNKT